MENLVIRKVEINDIDMNLDKIFIEGFRYHQNGRPDIFLNKTDEDLKQELIDTINNNDNQMWVAIDNDIVGYISAHIKEKHDKVLFVDELIVTSEYRKNGIGKRLMDEAKKFGKEQNCKRIEFVCWSFNKNALEAYNHMGYNQKQVVFEQDI